MPFEIVPLNHLTVPVPKVPVFRIAWFPGFVHNSSVFYP